MPPVTMFVEIPRGCALQDVCRIEQGIRDLAESKELRFIQIDDLTSWIESDEFEECLDADSSVLNFSGRLLRVSCNESKQIRMLQNLLRSIRRRPVDDTGMIVCVAHQCRPAVREYLLKTGYVDFPLVEDHYPALAFSPPHTSTKRDCKSTV